MNKTKSGKNRAARQAFTLIELMVVVVVISILMGGVFKLLSATSKVNKTAATKAKMERLENAISGFYAEYGMYPPVILHGTPDHDPETSGNKDDFDNDLSWGSDEEKARAAAWAAKCQPTAFEYPYPVEVDAYVGKKFPAEGVNGTLGKNAHKEPETDWQKIKMFKFGLLSFLLPRVELLRVPPKGETWQDDDPRFPQKKFFFSEQWKENNLTSRIGESSDEALLKALHTQRAIENKACARWLPNLEGQIEGGLATVLGVATRRSDSERFRVSAAGDDNTPAKGQVYRAKEGNSTKTVLLRATIVDGWNQEFFYHSDPPYQSYRLWSAGANKKTFPPWVPLSSVSSDRELVASWTADDIVGGSDNK